MSGRVVVIGAGSSGIAAVKCFQDAGFSDIVCYERRDVVGGLWYFKENSASWADEACVNRSTVINTSKEFMCYSDYPMPDHYPNFCHHRDVEAYFQDYCKHFGINKYIQHNIEVVSLRKHNSYNSTGRWELKLKDHKSGQESTEVFDFVLVANGHHGEASIPNFPGQEKFKGVTMHSKEFKDLRSVDGKRAIVVGIGNSGGDCSVELSKYMKVFLATRRGAWILNRLVKNGMPWDYTFHTRFSTFVTKWLPRSYRNKIWKAQLNERFDHDLYRMTPVHEPDSTHPTVNDELPNRIAAGMVIVKPNIRSFTEKGVVFDDGSFEDDIDVVVFATGYKVGYSFIDKSVLDIKSNKVEMFRNMFVPDLPKQTIAFLAVVQPLGAMFPLAEIQSRLAALVFKGDVKLPSPAVMKKDIQAHTSALQNRYIQTERHTIQVDWLPFMDEVAVLAGCKPSLLKLLFTDPVLFYYVAFGPGVPYQYRLHGPNPWPGARNAILTTLYRVKKPFETRTIPNNSRHKSTSWFKLLLLTSATAVALTFGVQYLKESNVNVSEYLPSWIKL
uniref:Flavin-containing monooxygenase n=1 Tax=Arion vulgaris TaxID=1028688 RepID=A0A0B7AC33_9EUPU